MIRFSCPACGATYRATIRHGDQRIFCQRCGQKLRIPKGRQQTILAQEEPVQPPTPLGVLFAKVMLVVVTLVWIASMLYGATLGYASACQEYKVINDEVGIYWNRDRTAFVTRDTVIAAALVRALMVGVCLPTALYAVAVILLVTIWLAFRS